MSGMANIQVPSTPNYSDLPVFNYSTTLTINQGEAVSVDPTNVVGGSNRGVGVIKTATSGDPSLGIAMESIPPMSVGRVRPSGVAQSISDGAITAGTFVDASATASRGVVAHVATHSAVGLALTTAADGEQIQVLVVQSKNA